ncbi:MAG: ArsA-related P-loop ATPase [Actinomycetota bacterium]|nr:ArsA-related P-loop ATPase [Actinomycetota bacterium]
MSRLVIVAGKGGVGKTTVAGTLAKVAAAAGATVTAVSIGDDRLARQLGVEPTPVDQLLVDPSASGELRTCRLDPEEALGAYLEDNGLSGLGRRMSRTGMLELVATSTPGIKELLVLGRLRQLESAEHTGLVVADGPAAGHAMALLRAPAAMSTMTRSGRLRDQANQALEMLGDPIRTQVVLVTLPEHTPVSETIEAAFALEDEIGVALGPVIVNRCAPPALPCLPATGKLSSELPPEIAAMIDRALDEDHLRHAAERANVAELELRLGVPRIELPDAPTRSGGVDLDRLTATLTSDR